MSYSTVLKSKRSGSSTGPARPVSANTQAQRRLNLTLQHVLFHRFETQAQRQQQRPRLSCERQHARGSNVPPEHALRHCLLSKASAGGGGAAEAGAKAAEELAAPARVAAHLSATLRAPIQYVTSAESHSWHVLVSQQLIAQRKGCRRERARSRSLIHWQKQTIFCAHA